MCMNVITPGLVILVPINSTLSKRFCEYDLTTNQRIAIYGVIITSAIIFSFLRGYLYLLVVLRASRKLHNKMFAAILRAPVYFFDTNPVGKSQPK